MDSDAPPRSHDNYIGRSLGLLAKGGASVAIPGLILQHPNVGLVGGWGSPGIWLVSYRDVLGGDGSQRVAMISLVLP